MQPKSPLQEFNRAVETLVAQGRKVEVLTKPSRSRRGKSVDRHRAGSAQHSTAGRGGGGSSEGSTPRQPVGE